VPVVVSLNTRDNAVGKRDSPRAVRPGVSVRRAEWTILPPMRVELGREMMLGPSGVRLSRTRREHRDCPRDGDRGQGRSFFIGVTPHCPICGGFSQLPGQRPHAFIAYVVLTIPLAFVMKSYLLLGFLSTSPEP